MNFTSALIIPCYNEQVRLPAFLKELRSTLTTTLIVTVDDGSSEPLPNFQDPAVIQLSYPHNQGKGYAVRHGWSWVTQHHPEIQTLGFADADGAVSASETLRLLKLFAEDKCDLLMASRILMLGRKVDRKIIRHLIGRVFATLLSYQLEIAAYDTQCGCKWITRAAFLGVRDDLCINGFTFDAELMARLLKKGQRVLEEPVDWEEKDGSKVRLWADSWGMLKQLRIIRRALKKL